jgi:hypothetical protein
MFRRPAILISLLAASIGVPYVALDEQLKSLVIAQWDRFTAAAPAEEPDPLAKIDRLLAPAAPAAAASTATPASAPPATVPLEEAIRFDVTPEWVTSRFTQVSSIVGDSEHVGLRVLLVSGATPTDVAGSLTFHFNQQQQVQRITLHGVTGDHSRLGELVVHKFGLRPTQTTNLAQYYGGDLNVPTSSLAVTALPIVRPEAPLARAAVALDLRRGDVAKVPAEQQQRGKILPSSYRRW